VELTALQSLVGTVVRTLLGYVHPTFASPFRADRGGFPSIPAPTSFTKRVHPLVSLALLQSSSCLRRPGLTRAPSLGSPTSSRPQPCESTADEHPRPIYVPPSAFHTLSTACSSPNLADLFHPAATSRFPAPGVSSPDLTGTTSSVARAFAPLAPSPAAGLTRRRRRASRRPQGLAPGRDPQHHRECYPPMMPVSPRALLLLRARFTSLEGAMNALSARGLGCSVLAVPRATNPQRLDRLATSMLYP